MTDTKFDFRTGHGAWPKQEMPWPDAARWFSSSGKT